jgi:RNA polymerase sigma-70 factor, ECF subfamily
MSRFHSRIARRSRLQYIFSSEPVRRCRNLAVMNHTVEKTSSSLLRRLRNPEDQASWGEFVALYEPLLTRYILKKGLSEHDAQDVIQGIFVSLLRKLPTFELDRGKGRFRTWLWQVMHNAVVDWARARKRVKAVEDKLRENWREESTEPDQDWDVELQKRVLEYAMQKVKERTNAPTWACFQEHLLKGRPGAEVGAELGLPANTVYVYAARIMARVRDQCAEYLEDDESK